MKDPGAIDPALARMMGWFLILLALPTAYFSFWRAYDKLASPAWPVTSAEIVRSSMYQRTGKSQDWCVKLSYRYSVDGKAYRSSRIGVSRIGNAGCHRDQAVTAWRLTSMAPGAHIRVHYRPRDPNDTAVFLAGLDFLDYFGVVLWVVLFVLGMSEARKRAPPAGSALPNVASMAARS
ncbi:MULTISPECIES: DUF3592 domain-containing protein [unclassified Janthinobacterium]|uniref:DUF3592 domain-containing protein n=1 Tax=unclassified Janthinobacterium TaxID=2610881 RepID=UPI0027143E8A|nr:MULTISPECIES: DUF3592 domain-containing protein [unclassified Janthinobacterium]MDO8064878.1 DUF3592 domain-containing protein [Janthinobacterium sp. SUN206]MDO8071217.1 DUF3592 domain-containing protein [Janthinobacterium sp. SUN176]